MSQNCMPKRTARVAAFHFARSRLNQAVAVLNSVSDVDHPDAADAMEEASSLIHEAMGQRGGSFIDKSVDEGLADLLEHFFG